MASIYLRGNIYWVKLGHPEGGRQVSFSLETPDQARAGLLAQMAQAHFDLRRPALLEVHLPSRILKFLGETGIAAAMPTASPELTPEAANGTDALDAPRPRTPISKVLAEYTGYLRHSSRSSKPDLRVH